MMNLRPFILVIGLTVGGSVCLGADTTGPAPSLPASAQTLPASAATLSDPDPVMELESALRRAAPTVRPEALHAALSAWEALNSRGQVARSLLTVIDYSLPSTAKRLWVFDLATHELLFNELVAHGRGSGENMAQFFSNEEGSLMTSLGAFVTGTTYNGKNGYSLKLHGIDAGLNDQAESRTIVMHGAPYVSETFAHTVGRLGRSHGCPAVRTEIAHDLIDRIKEQTLLYAWHPSMQTVAVATNQAP
ncbi:MAG TPA: murein L,D-transpeptidase catalytic domain family protein [Candidatus Polarisedimenticolia bacterium]|nr:murein L,D-transpeptidase catalytic domain family protein [Candidatus Polarisedimenticolia bacterium]